jgi:hypothetical protein
MSKLCTACNHSYPLSAFKIKPNGEISKSCMPCLAKAKVYYRTHGALTFNARRLKSLRLSIFSALEDIYDPDLLARLLAALLEFDVGITSQPNGIQCTGGVGQNVSDDALSNFLQGLHQPKEIEAQTPHTQIGLEDYLARPDPPIQPQLP